MQGEHRWREGKCRPPERGKGPQSASAIGEENIQIIVYKYRGAGAINTPRRVFEKEEPHWASDKQRKAPGACPF